jgi:hypothetical protein
MSYHYDATMTKSRMEMTNLGCALLEQMAMTDIEQRHAVLKSRIASAEERIANANEIIKAAKTEMRALTRKHNKHAASKAGFDAANFG